MKKSILAILLALVMVASLLPFGALADDSTVGAVSITPAGSGNYFFANGVPINISATPPDGGTAKKLENFDATGDDAYISWLENDVVKYVGVSQNAWVFGGADGRNKLVTVASTSINMTGGKIDRLFGGNFGEEEANTDFCSVVTGDVEISLSGNAVVLDLLHGAGARNTCVKGTVYMTFNGVNLSKSNTNSVYINGGSWGNGQEGTRDIANGTMDTDAVANNVVITGEGSKFALIGVGPSGSAKVVKGSLSLTNCEVGNLYFGAINGVTDKSSITLNGCKVDTFCSTNRGFVGDAVANIYNTEITTFRTGAANGCFTTDSGKPDGSGVTGSVTYNIDAGSTVKDAALTPLVVRDTNDNTTASIGNITLNKAGEPIELKVNSFVTVYNSDGTTNQDVKHFIVPDGSTVNLSGANVEVTAGQTLSNMGIITLDSGKTITIAEGAAFYDGGTTNATVEGNESSIHKYVAKVGNAGYKTLADAMNAVLAKGGTLYVLQDCELDPAQYSITKNVTIIGGNHDVVVTVKTGASTIAFDVNNGARFVLDGVNMTIKGTENQDPASKNDGTAINIGAGSTFELTGNSVLNFVDLNRGFTMGGVDAKFIINKGSFDVNTVDGNLTNGGTLEFENAYVNVNNCGDFGFSVNNISLDKSTLNMSNVGYSAIFINGGELTIDDSDVSISSCGSRLPKTGDTKADYVIDYNDVQTGMDVIVDEHSSLSLTGNNNNSVNVGRGVFESYGTFVGNVVVDPETTCVVTVEYNGTFTVAKNSPYTLPAKPYKSGYAFLGWSDGTTTYDALATVTITANTTFTAVWVRHPDTPYVPEPEQPEQPETPTFPFYDVPTSAWYYTAVKYVYDNKLMDGVDTYVFAPNDTLTRAMVWTIIARMSGVDTTGGNTWYAKAQEWVITNGISDGENPTAAITREQLVTMLYRYAQIKGYDVSVGENTNILSYVDATSISEYAMSAFQWACGSGLTEGDENGALTPLATATRAQAAAMIMRFCQSVK
uniref:S-layer homology domain-containing protein n=1 Tax=Candidatus Scatomorpha intestinigallinarum TaxID=2840923 RepID=UPI004029C184